MSFHIFVEIEKTILSKIKSTDQEFGIHALIGMFLNIKDTT